jgi:hypothetical protein
MDPTWRDPEECHYFGVAFEHKVLRDELARTGYYGLLDMPHGYNIDFMFRMDPKLEEFLPSKLRKKAHG